MTISSSTESTCSFLAPSGHCSAITCRRRSSFSLRSSSAMLLATQAWCLKPLLEGAKATPASAALRGGDYGCCCRRGGGQALRRRCAARVVLDERLGLRLLVDDDVPLRPANHVFELCRFVACTEREAIILLPNLLIFGNRHLDRLNAAKVAALAG